LVKALLIIEQEDYRFGEYFGAVINSPLWLRWL